MRRDSGSAPLFGFVLLSGPVRKISPTDALLGAECDHYKSDDFFILLKKEENQRQNGYNGPKKALY